MNKLPDLPKPNLSPKSTGLKRPRETVESSTNDIRIVVHLDVDACYVACERELRPELCSRPVAVCQYNPFGDLKDCGIDDQGRILYDGAAPTNAPPGPNTNGSMIAVSYEARARNVRRNDRGHDAVKKCPELCIVQVPVKNGKASLEIYREASRRLMMTLNKAIQTAIISIYRDVIFCSDDNGVNNAKDIDSFVQRVSSQIKVEKASIDEIYIDLSAPVQAIVDSMSTSSHPYRWNRLYSLLTSNDSASTHTTIGGLETSQAAIAANSLTKSDIRKGSSLQVLDSTESLSDRQAAWWNREFPRAWQLEEIALAVGALITLQARQGVIEAFNSVYTLSAGISTNKAMAKLASGLKKPNRQTLINPIDEHALQTLFHPLPLGRIRGLGGKFGDTVSEMLEVKTVGELAKVPLATLQVKFGKQAEFLYNIAKGNCSEEVSERTKAKSIGAGKTFRGVLSFSASDRGTMKKWLSNLLAEIMDRMDQDDTRYAKTLVVHLSMATGKDRSQNSKSAPLPRKCAERLKTALELAQEIAGGEKNNATDVMVTGMSVSATNFVPIATGSNSILGAFTRYSSQASLSAKGTGATPATIQKAESKSKAVHVKDKGIASFFAASQTQKSDKSDKTALRVADLHMSRKQSRSATGVTTAKSSVERTPSTVMPQQGSILVTPPFASSMKNVTCTQHSAISSRMDQVNMDLELSGEIQASCNNEAAKESVPSSTEPERPEPSTLGADSSCVDGDHTFEPQDAIALSLPPPVSTIDDPDLAYARTLQASFDREDEVIAIMEQNRARNSVSNKGIRRVSSGVSRSREGRSTSTGSIASFFVKKK